MQPPVDSVLDFGSGKDSFNQQRGRQDSEPNSSKCSTVKAYQYLKEVFQAVLEIAEAMLS